LYFAPNASQQSSTSQRLYLSHNLLTLSKLYGLPKVCANIIALVFGVIAASIKSASLITVNSGSSANLVAFATLTSPKLGDRAIKKGDEVIGVLYFAPNASQQSSTSQRLYLSHNLLTLSKLYGLPKVCAVANCIHTKSFFGFVYGGGNEQGSRFLLLSNTLLILLGRGSLTFIHTCLSFIRRGQDLITIEQEYYAFIQREHGFF
jgi:ABC-type transporter Mla MlaB component